MTSGMGNVVEESLGIARRALRQYDFSPRATLDVVHVSRNVVFRIEDPATDERAALRLHRADHHSVAQIKSELLWLDALAEDRTVDVPPPIATRSGERVARIDTAAGERLVTVAGWLEGTPASAHGADPGRTFELLGVAAARLHRHAERWTLPPGFCRRPSTAEQLLGPRTAPGSWRDAPGLDAEARALLEATEAAVRTDLVTRGSQAAGHGLVHGDLRPANLLQGMRDGRPTLGVVDFDDCGVGPFLSDFGGAVSFMEDDPRVPEFADRWATGYRTVRDLDHAAAAQLPAFVMLRRLVLLGRVARDVQSAPHAARGTVFTAGTCELAERFLSARAVVRPAA